MTKLNTDNNIDAKMWEMYSHKEDYRQSFLEDAQLWFFRNGYITESEELGSYIDSLDQGSSDSINYKANSAKMWEMYSHKENYEKSLLKKTELWLLRNGYIEECIELGSYIDSLEQGLSYDYDESEDNINSLEQYEDDYILKTKNNRKYNNKSYHNKVYHGSKSKIWTSYLKVTCFFTWFINIVLSMFICGSFLRGDRIYGVAIGALVGFISGFLNLPLIMTFITMCENISTTTDNTAKILMGIDKLNDYYNIPD